MLDNFCLVTENNLLEAKIVEGNFKGVSISGENSTETIPLKTVNYKKLELSCK
jgi:hypothetical protein